MTTKTILSYGTTQKLLKELEGKPVTFVARVCVNKVDFSLRYAYRKSNGQFFATGGLVLNIVAPSIERTKLPPFRRFYRIFPKNVTKTSDLISRKIAACLAGYLQEMERQQFVAWVDEAAEPLIDNKKFLQAVEKMEKKVGPSDYNTMTIRAARFWLGWIQNWQNPTEVPRI